MFLEAFKITGIAVIQILILGIFGYFLQKKNLLSEAGSEMLSRLVIDVTLPLLIFCQLVKDFKFYLYPDWWIFPLISIFITALGLGIGYLFSKFVNGQQQKLQFLSLVGFQNSGFLPLVLVAALLPMGMAAQMFIYLFLFLIGFNLAMWSLGAYILSFSKTTKFETASLFNMPVIASLAGLLVVFLGLNKLFSGIILRPLFMLGSCTLPLAMLVVGADLAKIRLEHVDKKAMALMALLKLFLLPTIGLALTVFFKFPALMGLLIMIQLAVPPATSLSVILKHYNKDDLLISQGIFIGHILSILTIPLFLSLYFALVMIK
jgi:predicted permease